MTYVETLEDLARRIGRTLRGLTRLRALGAPCFPVEGKGLPVEPLLEWMGKKGMAIGGKNLPRYPRLEIKGKRAKASKKGTPKDAAPAVAITADKPVDFDELLKIKARLTTAQAEEREAKAAMATLEHKKRIGEVIAKADVKRRDLARISTLRNRFLAMPRACAPKLAQLSASECEQILYRHVCDALQDLSEL